MIPLPTDKQIRDAIIDKYYEFEEWESSYDNSSSEIKAIGDYTGLSFNEVLDLPLSLFLLYKKDAWIYNNLRTEKGKKLLKDVWRLQQTKADLQAIHEWQERGDA